MIYCPSCGHVAHTRRAHFMDDGTKIMIAQCRNIYCSATFEASESFFSDSKDSGMEYISGKQRYRDSLTSASGSMKRPKRMLVTGYCCRRCKVHCQEHRGVCLRKSPSVFMCARIRAVVWCLKRFRPSTVSLSARSRRTNWQKACMKNRNCRQYA